MEKDFVTKCQQLSKTSKFNLIEKFHALTGENSAVASRAEEKQRKHIAQFLESYGCGISITDLRSLNEGSGSTNYDKFWDKVDQLMS